MTTMKAPIPATPAVKQAAQEPLPTWLAEAMPDLAADHARVRKTYQGAVGAHRRLATEQARDAAIRQDRDAHARAIVDGKPDPGPVALNRWHAEEEAARRAAQGAADAVTLAWEKIRGCIGEKRPAMVASLDAEEEAARARLDELLGELHGVLRVLDDTVTRKNWLRKAQQTGESISNQFGTITGRWPTYASSRGTPMPLVVEGRHALVNNVLQALAAYRRGG